MFHVRFWGFEIFNLIWNGIFRSSLLVFCLLHDLVHDIFTLSKYGIESKFKQANWKHDSLIFSSWKISSILQTIEDLDTRQLFDSDIQLAFMRLHTQLSLQPIQFTTSGFYVINYALLASVPHKIRSYISYLYNILLLLLDHNRNYIISNNPGTVW